jgi:hypothetical protein
LDTLVFPVFSFNKSVVAVVGTVGGSYWDSFRAHLRFLLAEGRGVLAFLLFSTGDGVAASSRSKDARLREGAIEDGQWSPLPPRQEASSLIGRVGAVVGEADTT